MFQRENLDEIMSKVEGRPRGFLKQNCVTWVGS